MEQALGELATRFGLSRRTLNQAAIKGHLPARRVGYQWVATPAAVQAWLKEARRRPGREPQRRVPEQLQLPAPAQGPAAAAPAPADPVA